jgi:pyridoxamine 5'-phosphate oxidase
VSEFAQPLREEDVDPDPFRQFSAWFSDAARAGVRAPEAAAVATATTDGAPSVRMVLVKHHDLRGFVFFTNYESRKGRELTANPQAALMFFWDALGRQVRVEGPVQQTSRQESEGYIRSRPRSSQISALASPQSEVVRDRAALEQRVAEVAAGCSGGDPPLPPAWGGFRLVPEVFEFWQHREDRLHDRLRYTGAGGAGGGWGLERLAP